MELKSAKTISEQIELLKERGIIIDDFDFAFTFLERNNYYRLNIYFHKLMDIPDHFKIGTTFSRVINIYENDKWLRSEILILLEPIEIKVRTQIAYFLGLTYGPNAFYNDKIYKSIKRQEEIMSTFSKEIQRNPKDPVVKHHFEKYEGKFPIWVIVEYFSFNTLSKYYNNLAESNKKIIAENSFNLNEHLLGQWLHVLSVLRNICAHYGYLFRREYTLRPIIARASKWKPMANFQLFAQFLVIKQLSEPQTWKKFVLNLENKISTGKDFSTYDYGFPTNWQSFLY